MKIVWVTRSFLDYRIPVYRELSNLVTGNFKLIYCADAVPENVREKTAGVLGDKALGLTGERRLGSKTVINSMANRSIRIPWQPGLINEIKAFSPDVIVTDGFFQWTSAALWLRAWRGIPHVMCYERTAHTERNAQWYRKIYRKIALRWIDAICCSGSLCRDYTTALGYPKDRITLGHMVADPRVLETYIDKINQAMIFDFRKKLKPKEIVFLYVGRLFSMKGIKELLTAWKRLSETTVHNASLLLVGDGPDKQSYAAYCRENELNNVSFTGKVPYDELPLYYNIADVFIIPTLEDNWSLVVPEAMACGLPILCSKYNGCCPELVKEGVNGWIFDPLDPESIGNTIEKALQHKNQLQTMGQRSREIVASHNAQAAAQAVFQAINIALGHNKQI